MRKPEVDIEIFKERQKELGSKIKGAALILVANSEYIRNHDVHHLFRQDSNFYYMTGFEEPDAVFVFRPGQVEEKIMFVRPKDPAAETWDGFRFGPEGVESVFAMDKGYNLEELSSKLPDLLKDVNKIYYRKGNHRFDSILDLAMETVQKSFGRSGKGLLPIEDFWELIGEQRVIKSEKEKEWLREAANLSAKAHTNAMKFTVPGVTERQVLAVIEYTFKMGGSARPGYNSIVASGKNATTLHYVFNDEKCSDGDLLLIDAGTEWNHYSADITRTFPVSGKFSDIQRDVYSRVLEIQKRAVDAVKPGVTFVEIQTQVIEDLTQVMIDLKLLSGEKSKLIESQAFKKYYPHNIGHFLGLDVHDQGLYTHNGEPRPLEEGMCLTIEPGLYIPIDDKSAPQELRGIGVRIEDDILVTNSGNENLTSGVPKEISEIEALVGKGLDQVI